MRYLIRCLAPDEYDSWDSFVDRSSQGTLFHKSYWLRASGMRLAIYGCFKGNELVAGIPVAYRQLWNWKLATQPPLTPYLGIIFRDSDAKYVARLSSQKELAGLLIKELQRNFDYISISLTPSFIDLHPFKWNGFRETVNYTYIVTLDVLNDVWRNMDDTRRRNIRKAEKDALTTTRNGSLADILDLVEETFKRQQIPLPFPKKLAASYNSILEEKKICTSFLSKNQAAEKIGGVYIAWDDRRSYYLLGGYRSAEKHSGAVALALWEAIKFTKEKLKLAEFDFEGSSIPQVEMSLRKFGGRLTPYYTVTWGTPQMLAALHVRRLLKTIPYPNRPPRRGVVE